MASYVYQGLTAEQKKAMKATLSVPEGYRPRDMRPDRNDNVHDRAAKEANYAMWVKAKAKGVEDTIKSLDESYSFGSLAEFEKGKAVEINEDVLGEKLKKKLDKLVADGALKLAGTKK